MHSKRFKKFFNHSKQKVIIMQTKPTEYEDIKKHSITLRELEECAKLWHDKKATETLLQFILRKRAERYHNPLA